MAQVSELVRQRYCWLKNGVIPAVKIGLTNRIPRDEFLKKYGEQHNGDG